MPRIGIPAIRIGRGRRCGRVSRAAAEDGDAHRAGAAHADREGGAAGEIEAAAAHERAAVIDAHHDAAAGAGIGHLQARAEGQAAMRGGEAIGIETLPRGGPIAGLIIGRGDQRPAAQTQMLTEMMMEMMARVRRGSLEGQRKKRSDQKRYFRCVQHVTLSGGYRRVRIDCYNVFIKGNLCGNSEVQASADWSKCRSKCVISAGLRSNFPSQRGYCYFYLRYFRNLLFRLAQRLRLDDSAPQL